MLILDRPLARVKDACAGFPDERKSAGGYSMAASGLSGFSPFFMQSESFLAHRRSLEEGQKTSNCHTLFGMMKIPTANHIRSMLDPVHPSHPQGPFDQAVAELRAHRGMKAFERLGGRVLIAFDGTEYFCSYKLGCPHCLTRKRSNGKTESYRSMGSRNAIRPGSPWLASTIVAPGHNMAMPPMPVPGLDPGIIAKQDAAEPSERLLEPRSEPEAQKQQDGERNATKRWLAAHAERVKELVPFSSATTSSPASQSARPWLSSGGDFLFTAKPDSHKTLHDFMNGAALDERSIARKEGAKKLTCRCRWFLGTPLREGEDALNVNWIGVTIAAPRARSRECRRDRRLRQGALEDRERELQRPKKLRLSSRT